MTPLPDADRATLRTLAEAVCRRAEDPVEIIMKDVHTLADEPDRLERWVAIAREEIAAR